MAFDSLKVHKGTIETMKREGRPLAEIVDALGAKGVATTPGTVSRFLKEIGQPYRPRDLTAAEKPLVDQTVLLTEVFAEVQGAKEEMRAVIEKLAGQVAVLTATVEEMEKAVAARQPAATRPGPSPVPASPATALDARLVRRVWLRAFIVSTIATGVTATAAVAKVLGWM